jgi:hypothetical protein
MTIQDRLLKKFQVDRLANGSVRFNPHEAAVHFTNLLMQFDHYHFLLGLFRFWRGFHWRYSMLNHSNPDYLEFQRNFCNIIPDSDAGVCYLFREHCRQQVHAWRRGGIKANFPQILGRFHFDGIPITASQILQPNC